MTKRRNDRMKLGGVLVALTMVAAAGTGLAAAGPEETVAPAAKGAPANAEEADLTVPLRWIGGAGTHGQPIDGSSVTTTATAGTVTLTAEAVELKPGHAYTVWLFFWDRPELCVGHPNAPDTTLRCGAPDIFGGAEGTIVWGDGAVADADGRATFALSREAGACWDDPEQVAFEGLDGEPCLPDDASVPEYQLAVRDHGPYDPGTYGDAQTTTLEGGCEDYTCRESQSTGAAQQVLIRFPAEALGGLPGRVDAVAAGDSP